jgi:nucleoside-diphosphate-sugar epimerase
MEIIGSGFLARHLRVLQERHPGTVAVAAGVSWTASTSDADFTRETDLVRDTALRCGRTGQTLLFFSTSSAAVYGASHPGRESDPVAPRNPYGAHKLGLERLVAQCADRYLILRVAHLVGDGQPGHQLLPTLAGRLLAGEVVRVQRAATRDLIAVTDAVAIMDALLSRGVHGETVNVASGVAIPVVAIVDHLERRLGAAADRELVDGGAAHLVCTDKLRSLVPEAAGLGFGPRYPFAVIDSYLASRAERIP